MILALAPRSVSGIMRQNSVLKNIFRCSLRYAELGINRRGLTVDHSQELPFEWDNDTDGLPADKFDRAKYAKFLTNYLINKSKEENYVLNLNATWGAGKTWFLKKWFTTIKDKHPAIYIDCWKNDHSKDPFLAVMSAISNGLDELVEKEYKKDSLSSKGVLLIKSVAPEIAKGLIKKFLGLDTDEITKVLDDDDSSSISEVGGQLVSELIKLHEKANDTLDEFKLTVSNYLDVIDLESPRNLPLFVFLDELDRCRPTYAIETLETVKHIFDMKRVVFIIATDKEQLQHSIRAVYGNDFNSSKYLDRFFNRTVTLQQKSNEEFIEHKLTTSSKLNEFISSALSNDWLYGSGEEKKSCVLMF